MVLLMDQLQKMVRIQQQQKLSAKFFKRLPYVQYFCVLDTESPNTTSAMAKPESLSNGLTLLFPQYPHQHQQHQCQRQHTELIFVTDTTVYIRGEKIAMWRKLWGNRKFLHLWRNFGILWKKLRNFKKFWEILPQFTRFHVEKN